MTLLPIFLRLERPTLPGGGRGHGRAGEDRKPARCRSRHQRRRPASDPGDSRTRRAGNARCGIERVFEPADLERQLPRHRGHQRARCESRSLSKRLCAATFSATRSTILPTAISTSDRWSPAAICKLPSPRRAKVPRSRSGCGAKSMRSCLPTLDRGSRELGDLRREVRARTPGGEARNLLLHELAQRPLCGSPTCPTRQFAQEQIRTMQKVEAPA